FPVCRIAGFPACVGSVRFIERLPTRMSATRQTGKSALRNRRCAKHVRGGEGEPEFVRVMPLGSRVRRLLPRLTIVLIFVHRSEIDPLMSKSAHARHSQPKLSGRRVTVPGRTPESSDFASSNGLIEAQPFLKWAGGKSQLLAQFDTYLPEA